MDVAAEVIGIRPLPAKLSAFAVSSFTQVSRGTLGVCPPWRVGAIGVQYQSFIESAVHDHHRRHGLVARRILRRSIHILLPIILNQVPGWFGVPISTALASHLEAMIFGSLMCFPDCRSARTCALS